MCFRAQFFLTGLWLKRIEVRLPHGSAYISSSMSPFALRQPLWRFSSSDRSCWAPKLKSSKTWSELRETDTRGFACMRRAFVFMKLRVVFVRGHSDSFKVDRETAYNGEGVSTMEVARHTTRFRGCSRVSVKLWMSNARAARVFRRASR